jgi:hypothetical protein
LKKSKKLEFECCVNEEDVTKIPFCINHQSLENYTKSQDQLKVDKADKKKKIKNKVLQVPINF